MKLSAIFVPSGDGLECLTLHQLINVLHQASLNGQGQKFCWLH